MGHLDGKVALVDVIGIFLSSGGFYLEAVDVLEDFGATVEEDCVGGDDVAEFFGDVANEFVVEGAVRTIGGDS